MPKIPTSVSINPCSVRCQQSEFCTCQTDLTCMNKLNQYQTSKHWGEEMFFACYSLCYLLIVEKGRRRKTNKQKRFRKYALYWCWTPTPLSREPLQITQHPSLHFPVSRLSLRIFWLPLSSATCKQKTLAILTPLQSSHLFFILHYICDSNSQSRANLFLFNTYIRVHIRIQGGQWQGNCCSTTWLQMLSLENAAAKLTPASSKNIHKLRFFLLKGLYLDQTLLFFFQKNKKKYIHNTRAIMKSNLKSWLNDEVTKNCLTGQNDNFSLILFLELFKTRQFYKQFKTRSMVT